MYSFSHGYVKKCLDLVSIKQNDYLSQFGIKMSITNHFIDRFCDRAEHESDLQNVIVLIKRSITDHLCQILFSFHIPYQNVWIHHKNIKIIWTYDHEKRILTLRTFIKNFTSGDDCAFSRYSIFME